MPIAFHLAKTKRTTALRMQGQNVKSRLGVPVPEGHPTIAQRFNIGKIGQQGSSPEGTADTWRERGQPSLRDWCASAVGIPTLKCWAIVGCPSGTRTLI